MINEDEIEVIAARFGAPDMQVIRDHLISHVIAALANLPPALLGHVTFFGGTALCRTWCPDLRLSEDIDLLIDTPDVTEDIIRHVSRSLRREFPEHSWEKLGSQHQVDTRNLHDTASTVKVQFVQWRQSWKDIPTTLAPVQLRYSDLPMNLEMIVPTPSGFAAMKIVAWSDRHAPRDLYDLAALAGAGHIDRAAVELVRSITGVTPSTAALEKRVPETVERSWQSELGHQLGQVRTADECLVLVRASLEQATGVEPGA